MAVLQFALTCKSRDGYLTEQFDKWTSLRLIRCLDFRRPSAALVASTFSSSRLAAICAKERHYSQDINKLRTCATVLRPDGFSPLSALSLPPASLASAAERSLMVADEKKKSRRIHRHLILSYRLSLPVRKRPTPHPAVKKIASPEIFLAKRSPRNKTTSRKVARLIYYINPSLPTQFFNNSFVLVEREKLRRQNSPKRIATSCSKPLILHLHN